MFRDQTTHSVLTRAHFPLVFQSYLHKFEVAHLIIYQILINKENHNLFISRRSHTHRLRIFSFLLEISRA